MPPFAGNGVDALYELPTNTNASANTCAKNNAEYDAGVGTCTIDGLRQCEAVGIVGDTDRPGQE